MNSQQIKEQIRQLRQMTYAETVNNQQRIQAEASWEIALQIALLREEIENANDREENQ